MSEPKKRRWDWRGWVAIGIALPILYVLSIGPVCLFFSIMYDRWPNDESQEAFSCASVTLYAPLAFVVDHIDHRVERYLYNYVRLCGAQNEEFYWYVLDMGSS